MRSLTARLCAGLAIVCAIGCGGNNRTIFVPEESPMRTGPGAKMRVWTRPKGSAEWVLSGNEVPLPEGMYIVSPSWVAPDDP